MVPRFQIRCYLGSSTDLMHVARKSCEDESDLPPTLPAAAFAKICSPVISNRIVLGVRMPFDFVTALAARPQSCQAPSATTLVLIVRSVFQLPKPKHSVKKGKRPVLRAERPPNSIDNES